MVDHGGVQSTYSKEMVEKMKKLSQKFSLSASKIDRRHLQIFLTLLVLGMLVVGAGAPGVTGGGGGF